MNQGLQQRAIAGEHNFERLHVRRGSGGRGDLLAAILLIAGVVACACGPARVQGSKGEPAYLESIEGSKLKRVVVTAKAAERIGLQTAPVREELIRRTRTIGGEVVASSSVRLRLTASDLSRIDHDQPATVLQRPRENAAAKRLEARVAAAPASSGGVAAELYYALSEQDHGLVTGERVMVMVPLVGGELLRKLVPHSAVLYDLDGLTWAYTQVAPLSFVRVQIAVDYVEGEVAFLTDGPVAGTSVVTVGATELFGTEFKVGK